MLTDWDIEFRFSVVGMATATAQLQVADTGLGGGLGIAPVAVAREVAGGLGDYVGAMSGPCAVVLPQRQHGCSTARAPLGFCYSPNTALTNP